jgi:hypothetical protein
MEFGLILLSGIVATLLMTAFSYVMSVVFKDQFREPQLLNQLISGASSIPFTVSRFSIAGWIIHFLIGILFALQFNLLVNHMELEPYLHHGLVFGFIAGLIGIIGWKVMFWLNDNPPEININKFFFQLVIAHMIFGAGLVLIY